jgi:hypothetical protein
MIFLFAGFTLLWQVSQLAVLLIVRSLHYQFQLSAYVFESGMLVLTILVGDFGVLDQPMIHRQLA